MTRAYVPRDNQGGNYCGHNPAAPRLTLAAPPSESLPLIIRRAMERILDFYWRPETIPTLNAANNSRRRLRSEGRESSLLAMLSILKFTDVASLRCGVPTEDGFAGLTIEILAKHAGMGLRRMQRAVAYLKRAGLLTVATIAQKQADGTYVGVAAIKAVSKHLWGCFGLLEMLKHERDKASKRIKKQARQARNVVSRATSRGALALAGLRGLVQRPRDSATDPEQRRRIALRELELRQQYPDWSITDIQQQARQDLA